jgi:hypothetical protein
MYIDSRGKENALRIVQEQVEQIKGSYAVQSSIKQGRPALDSTRPQNKVIVGTGCVLLGALDSLDFISLVGQSQIEQYRQWPSSRLRPLANTQVVTSLHVSIS